MQLTKNQEVITESGTPITIEQVATLIDQKLGEFQKEFQRELEKMFATKASHDDVDRKIQLAVEPLSLRLDTVTASLSGIHGQLGSIGTMSSELSRITGAVEALTSMRSSQMETVRTELAEFKIKQDDTHNELVQMRRDLDTLQFDTYGNPKLKDGPPSLIEMVRQIQREQHEQVRKTLELIEKTNATVSKLTDRVDVAQDFIEKRRAIENAVISMGRKSLTFFVETAKGKVIVATLVAAAGLAVVEKSNPGSIQSILEAIASLFR